MSAAFAASSLVFKQSEPEFAAKLQQAAVDLYTAVSRLLRSPDCVLIKPP